MLKAWKKLVIYTIIEKYCPVNQFGNSDAQIPRVWFMDDVPIAKMQLPIAMFDSGGTRVQNHPVAVVSIPQLDVHST